jgi:cardiolipin synthase
MQITTATTRATKKAAKPKAKAAPKPTADAKETEKREGLAADLRDSLVRYHQLEDTKNGSRQEGVQFNPLAPKTERGLAKHIGQVAEYLSRQENIEFRPSPNFEPYRSEFRGDLAKKSAAYVKSSAKQMLEQATAMIGDPALRALVQQGLKTAPEMFYTAPSSSSGKYHPADEINEGGLVLHTARVVAMAQHLADFYEVSKQERDILTAGLILHDTRKGGDDNWKTLKDYAPDHGDVAARAIADLKGAGTAKAKEVIRLAANHMAQWTQVVDPNAKPSPDGKIKSTRDPRPPADKLEQIVSYADYLASQDNVYVLPPGYEADYLKDIPINNPNAGGKVPDHLKFFTAGNKVTPLADSSVTPKDLSDDIFAQIHQSIDSAKKSIQIEMFGLGQIDIVNKLIAKHNEGVKVQVVLDPVNEEYEVEKQKCADKLMKAGIEVVFYPTQEPTEKNRFAQINHVKMMIVDGDEAIIGGMNWGGHSPANHDVDVKIEGPIVDKMEHLFNKDYAASGGKDPLPVEKTEAHPEGKSLVSLATGSHEPSERQIKAALHRAIRDAKKNIRAELFFLTDWSLIGALKEAAGRGVKVELLLNPSQIGDTKFNEKACADLRKAGCEVKWFKPNPETGSKLHAKLGIFDDEEVILGSANWTGNGLTWNREANVDIVDKDVASYYIKMFTSDMKKGAQNPTYLEGDKDGAAG